jgi:hypothetical protein
MNATMAKPLPSLRDKMPAVRAYRQQRDRTAPQGAL